MGLSVWELDPSKELTEELTWGRWVVTVTTRMTRTLNFWGFMCLVVS